MTKLILLLLLISPPPPQERLRPGIWTLPRMCRRVSTEVPKAVGLDCGLDSQGEALILDIPETWYQFPRGEVFKVYFFSDGTFAVPVDHQPKGSRVIKSPPCKRIRREAVPATNAGPCNPELEEGS